MTDYTRMGRQFLAGGEVERRSVHRELQSIATELMFGGEPTALIARLMALGAPPAEAKRIIETAENDPLIANGRAMALVLRKRDWLLDALERQQRLLPSAGTIERRSGLSAEEFLERYYSRARPVILTEAMKDWRAVEKWNAEYLAATVGEFDIEFRAPEGTGPAAKERRGRMPFSDFVRKVAAPGGGGRAYMVADEISQNVAVASWLNSDLGSLDPYLDPDVPARNTIWIGGAGAFTPLHHDLVNCLVAQVAGRNRFKIVAAADVSKIYNQHGVLSEIADLDAPGVDSARYPGLKSAHIHEVTLEPGEILYLPLAWWYQVRALEFSVSVTYTNFRWPNDFFRSYPSR